MPQNDSLWHPCSSKARIKRQLFLYLAEPLAPTRGTLVGNSFPRNFLIISEQTKLLWVNCFDFVFCRPCFIFKLTKLGLFFAL